MHKLEKEQRRKKNEEQEEPEGLSKLADETQLELRRVCSYHIERQKIQVRIQVPLAFFEVFDNQCT